MKVKLIAEINMNLNSLGMIDLKLGVNNGQNIIDQDLSQELLDICIGKLAMYLNRSTLPLELSDCATITHY